MRTILTTHAAPVTPDAIEAAIDGAAPAALLAGVVVAVVAVQLVVWAFLLRWTRTPGETEGDAHRFLRAVRTPIALALAALAALLVMRHVRGNEAVDLISPAADRTIAQIVAVLLILAVTGIASALVGALINAFLERYDTSVADNRRARSVHTQWRVIGRILFVLVWIVGIASALMTFESIRQFGLSILASAGLGALVLGLAAQRSIGNFLAGIQIALTQPIRLDDVVIIEGEWGRVEEILTTYVVVKIWDDRRLIVPFSTIIEKPFQNWTRTRADLLGTVFLRVDFSAPLDEIRAELRRICEASPNWDRRLCLLQVTDCSADIMEIRALVSTADASKGWDLRCEVREGLLRFLHEKHPSALPRRRLELERADGASAQDQPPLDPRGGRG